jgi:hypothetical protein
VRDDRGCKLQCCGCYIQMTKKTTETGRGYNREVVKKGRANRDVRRGKTESKA